MGPYTLGHNNTKQIQNNEFDIKIWTNRGFNNQH